MSAITKNLPWFIRDLGISIVGEECYTSLVENLDISDVKCIKYSISKGLGIGIVVGGSIVKVPQLLIIVKARSARGLSLSAYVLETLSYGITLAYSYRNGFPFSTYGENFFLTLQNIVITLLMISYTRSPKKSANLFVSVAGLLVSSYALSAVPIDSLSLLQLSTLPLSLFSKLPQIRQNQRSQSTGQLSAFAIVSQILGCLARLFTTATEVSDPIVSAGFALALVLNVVLGAQLFMYWGQDEKAAAPPIELKELSGKSEPSVPSSVELSPKAATSTAYDPAYSAAQSRTAQRVATPPPQSPGSRKWARKLD